MKNIKAVIFDMDGVLIDSELAYSSMLVDYFEEKNYPYTEAHLLQLIGSSHERGCEIISEMTNGLVEPNAMWKDWHRYLKEHPLDYMALRVDGVEEVMQYLKANNYKIGLSSATEKEGIISHMKECELYDYFDAISSGHEVKHSKPAPDVYLKTIDLLHVTPQECIVLEDSFYGIRAAKNANVHRVLARNVKALPIDQREADEIIEDMREVIQVLERKSV
ncbi:MAG: HAD family phosphatase [Erysipelotrichia bacterium]|nr:HAD family phosphatase [Erysipelotrichia bacterium]NCC55501.1 HAD family phosphatase [Erysipelotrichia bacterium]